MREAVELYLIETAKAGEPIPDALATTVNIDEFDPGHETKEYFLEWLPVSLPQSISQTETSQAA
jgi:hypothetical protein